MKLDGTLTQLKVGTTTVNFVTEVSWEESCESETEKYLGGTDAVEVKDLTYTFSSTHTHDDEDAGQNLLVVGTTVTVSLYPQGSTTGKQQITFDALVKKKPLGIKRDEKTKQTIEYEVNASTVVKGVVA